jgi:hypothetical protein
MFQLEVSRAMLTYGTSFKVLCWLCIGLALSTCAYDACLAQSPEEGVTPDSLDGGAEDLRVGEEVLLVDTPADTVSSTGQNIQPFHKKWWVWAIVTTAIAVTAVLVGGGEEKKTEEDLPDFPDPPDR